MKNNILEIFISEHKINLFPLSIAEEIIQNIQMILTTIKGTLPLDRRFGLDINFIDDPEPKAKAKLIIFITESIQEYEPRVIVEGVEFVPDTNAAMNGGMFPKVAVRIKDEYI